MKWTVGATGRFGMLLLLGILPFHRSVADDATDVSAPANPNPASALVGDAAKPAAPEEPPPAADPDDPAPAGEDAADAIELALVVQSVEHLRANKYLLRASVANEGQVEATGPLRVVVSGSTEPGFELAREDGRTEADEPYVEFVRKRRTLERDSESRARAIQFQLEAEDLDEERLAKIEFEYRILGPGVRGRSARTKGRRDADREAEDDEEEAESDRSEDDESASNQGDRRDGGRRDSRRPDGRSDGDGDGANLGNDVFATAKSTRNGEPVVIAYVSRREAARRLPERIRGERAVAQLSFPFDLYGTDVPPGGGSDKSLIGRRVIRRSGNTPPRAGLVAAVGLAGTLRAKGARRRVTGLTVVQGLGGSFAGAADVGQSVEDETGKSLGVVVGGNATFTLLAPGGKGERRRVLFVGNSYTMNNDLPALVAEVARAAGHTLEVERSLEGGATLRRHLQKGDALRRLQVSKFDAVMLQEQSLTPILNRAGMWAAATELDAAIGKAGAKTVFFMTWARRGKPEMTKGLADSYEGIAKTLRAEVAPVGHAWHDVIENAGLGLHTDDGSHPNATGSLLAALVMYATLFDEDPRKVPGNLGLPASQAAVLKNAAWNAARRTARSTPRSTPDDIRH